MFHSAEEKEIGMIGPHRIQGEDQGCGGDNLLAARHLITVYSPRSQLKTGMHLEAHFVASHIFSNPTLLPGQHAT